MKLVAISLNPIRINKYKKNLIISIIKNQIFVNKHLHVQTQEINLLIKVLHQCHLRNYEHCIMLFINRLLYDMIILCTSLPLLFIPYDKWLRSRNSKHSTAILELLSRQFFFGWLF